MPPSEGRAATPPVAAHWDSVYRSKAVDELSWFQGRPETSLRLIGRPGSAHRPGPVVDIGAGTSILVDVLLDEGWPRVTVLDVSEEALEITRTRLGADASRVDYVVSDVLDWRPSGTFVLWHDRAVLHFLTDPDDREDYVATAAAAVVPGGRLVIGGFAPGGPTQCSGLPTARRSADQLAEEFGAHFRLVHAEGEDHHTPTGAEQLFEWTVFERRG